MEEQTKRMKLENRVTTEESTITTSGLYQRLSVSVEKFQSEEESTQFNNSTIPALQINSNDQASSSNMISLTINEKNLDKETRVHQFFKKLFSNEISTVYTAVDTNKTIIHNRKPDFTFIPKMFNLTENDPRAIEHLALGFLELKKDTKVIETPHILGQLCDYMFRALKDSYKSYVFGFVSNFKDIIFVKMRKSMTELGEENIITTRSPKLSLFSTGIQNSDGYSYLKRLLNTPTQQTWTDNRTFTLGKFIAAGATSLVFDFGDGKIIKLAKTPSDNTHIITETKTITFLDEKGVNPLPKIVEHGNYWIVMEKCYPCTSLSKSEMKALVELVKSFHQAGVLHRDIRPQNIMKTDSTPLLIDFGFSVRIEEHHSNFAGTSTFCAEQYSEHWTHRLTSTYLKIYDYESLLKVFVYFADTTVKDSIDSCNLIGTQRRQYFVKFCKK
ncbi:hypothetical protein FDP41_005563 [Naegleria fowleri]|uniref:Protein kinase domain-containing protein n=1 Tax=Naegleria fowleri TaxID=5763 RepID=A0A6A5BRK3_NAEFO|nr:uncharacterized protein FDP41_005563 [Naegleria fowleri]KAF0975569.1 hypothetical protein FDP41_005563 [Naegleria fowleri]